MLVLAVVLTPALAGGEKEPVAHIGDFLRPAAILFGQPFATPKTVDDGLDLQEFCLGILGVIRTCDSTFGAGA